MITIKANLENIVKNIDGSITFYFKQGKENNTSIHKLITELQKCQKDAKNGLRIDVSKYYEQRSLDANAYFHFLIDKIAKELGKSVEDVKLQMVLDYGTIKRDKYGNKIGFKLPVGVDVCEIYKYTKWFDTRTENGVDFDCYIVYKETHTLNTKEMSQLINGVIQEAQNLNIETKTPDQIAEMMSLWEKK